MDNNKRKSISALVVTHNEEMHLSDCLQALVFADELVVVLDDCTDNSKIIASKFTKNLIEGNWELEGDRRNAGIMACHSDWILEVDSDERVSNSLANEIKAAIENNGTTISDFRRVDDKTGKFQQFLKVYDKKDQPCTNCGVPIQRIIQQQRSTFFCPKCQH